MDEMIEYKKSSNNMQVLDKVLHDILLLTVFG